MNLKQTITHEPLRESPEHAAEPVKRTRPTVRPPIAQGHDDVALIDAKDFCALGRFSVSYLHDEVRAGRAPEPLRFGPRCSRWKLSDAKAYLARRIEAAQADTATATANKARSAKAAAKAKALQAAKAEDSAAQVASTPSA